MKKYQSSFKRKLLISYLIFTLLPVIFIGFFAYNKFSAEIIKHTEVNIKNTLQQIKENIMYRSEIIERMSYQIFSDLKLQQLMMGEYDAESSYWAIKNDIEPILQSQLNISSGPVSLKLYMHNRTIPEIYYNRDEYPLQAKTFELYNIERILNNDWYNNSKISNTEIKWQQVDNDKKNNNISLLRNIIDFRDQKKIGFLRIIVSLDNIFLSIKNRSLIDGSMIYLSKGSDIVYGDKHFINDYEKNENYLKIEENIYDGTMQLTALIPLKELGSAAREVRLLTIQVSIISFLILSILGIMVSTFFSRNINQIVESIDSFREGDFSERIDYSGNNKEFIKIASAFNGMAETIEELIDEVFISDIDKKEAELRLIHAQINPHFLYNTLSSISRLGRFGQVDQMHQMILELSKFYRLSLNRGESLISIRNELEHLKSYINIQKIKYGERLQLSYDIQVDIINFSTVKFILQPLVENSLEHAWFKGNLFIRIIGYKENDRIIFKVIDNGIGMNIDIINEVLNRNDVKRGYGLYNVDERIKLHFGKEYGIDIFSIPNAGTTVSIVIPTFKK